MNAQEMITAARRSGGGYAALHQYTGASGVCQSVLLRLGVTRAFLYEQSILWADHVNFQALAAAADVDENTARTGLATQVASWRKSLDGLQRTDNFRTIAATPSGRRLFSLKTDDDGNDLPEKGLYLNAMQFGEPEIHEDLCIPGIKRNPPKSDLAKVNAQIRRKAPIGSFRTYNLRADNFKSFTFGKDTLTPADITSVVASLTA